MYDTPLLKHHSYEHGVLLYSFDFVPEGERGQPSCLALRKIDLQTYYPHISALTYFVARLVNPKPIGQFVF